VGIVPPPPVLLARLIAPEIGGPVSGFALTLVKKKNVYYEGVISMRSYGVIDLRVHEYKKGGEFCLSVFLGFWKHF